MSRTYKTRPARIRHPEYFMPQEEKYEIIPYSAFYVDRQGVEHEYVGKVWLKRPGILPKKKKHDDSEYHWMQTPGWFICEFMNRPQRKASKRWERQVVKLRREELEDADAPNIGKKPHIYYW